MSFFKTLNNKSGTSRKNSNNNNNNNKSSKQKIYNLTFYAIFVCLSVALSFLESLVPLDFIAPGVKIGLANLSTVFLIRQDKFLGAVGVNATRILLSALLFSGFSSLPFSVCGAILSFLVMFLMQKFKIFSGAGISAAGGFMHNLGQIIVSLLFVPVSVLKYFPFLGLAGIFTGTVIGILTDICIKRLKK